MVKNIRQLFSSFIGTGRDMKKAKIEIILPPVASTAIDLDLVNLTEYLTKKVFKGEYQGGGLLGGEFGYGVDYENDVFMIHKYCWCDQEEKCLWCMMNDPKENKNYKKMKKELRKMFGKFWEKWGGAPTFFYKPTKVGVRWYKWIGRDMEWKEEPTPKEWRKIYAHCVKSISPIGT